MMRDFNYTYNEVMHEIPYISLLLQYASVIYPKKKKVSQKEIDDKMEGIFKSVMK